MKNYLTTSEAAVICQVSRGTILRWIRDGLIKASATMGGHSRVAVSDLKLALEKMGMPVSAELTESSAPSAPFLKILIVEDDFDLRQILLVTLQRHFPQSQIREAGDGFSAGFLIDEFNPHIIFLDVRLPGISGEEICRKIRSNPKFKSTAIIGMTAYGRETVERMLAAGADTCFEKDYKDSQLIDFIRRFEARLSEMIKKAA